MTKSTCLYTPFSALSFEERCRAKHALLERIEGSPIAKANGFFSLHHDEPGRPHELDQWVQVYFVGEGDGEVYNMYIFCGCAQFWESVAEKARQNLSSHFPTPSFDLNDINETTLAYERFLDLSHSDRNGKTTRQLLEEEELRIIQCDPPSIYTSFEVDNMFEYGTGVYAVIEESFINDSVIKKAISEFFGRGAASWKCKKPIPRDLLPAVTQLCFLSDFKSYLSGSR